MAQRPNILIYKKLITPLELALQELAGIDKEFDGSLQRPDFINKGVFAYVIARYEAALADCLKQFLIAFPDRLDKNSFNANKNYPHILGTDLTSEVIELLIQDFIASTTYSKMDSFIELCCTSMGINNLSNHYKRTLREKKARRNLLMHNNLVIDNTYIYSTSSDPRKIGNPLAITDSYLRETISDAISSLNAFKENLHDKYHTYNKAKAIKQAWQYLFQQPMMNFDDYWEVDEQNHVSLKVDTIRKRFRSLSSGERTILAYWVQNYSASICDEFFKFKDLNMQVSNNWMMIYSVSLFDRFPLLLQNNEW
ncbi:MAG TPA: hypothetical protein VKB19_19115 [Pedobacter sp.]|nr:hypothetical protein [Pedobacter sp.]